MTYIHPTAIIEDTVTLEEGIYIGPFCYIRGNVKIDSNCQLHSHIVMEGDIKIGKNNEFFPFVCIGMNPQDKKFKKGDESRIEIGDNNIFREYTNIHGGTIQDQGLTKIGDNNLFMISTHIAHDCMVENNIIIANLATLAGHVTVESNVIIGGLTGIQQFCRIGQCAIIGFHSSVELDILPYSVVKGQRSWIAGVNIIGMKRKSIKNSDIKLVSESLKKFIANESVHEDILKDLEQIQVETQSIYLANILNFVKDENRTKSLLHGKRS